MAAVVVIVEFEFTNAVGFVVVVIVTLLVGGNTEDVMLFNGGGGGNGVIDNGGFIVGVGVVVVGTGGVATAAVTINVSNCVNVFIVTQSANVGSAIK